LWSIVCGNREKEEEEEQKWEEGGRGGEIKWRGKWRDNYYRYRDMQVYILV